MAPEFALDDDMSGIERGDRQHGRPDLNVSYVTSVATQVV
jgi:hypothetical protein